MTTCKELIVTDLATRGDGKVTPLRRITQVFEKDGTLVAECDPAAIQITFEQLQELSSAILRVQPPDEAGYIERWLKSKSLFNSGFSCCG